MRYSIPKDTFSIAKAKGPKDTVRIRISLVTMKETSSTMRTGILRSKTLKKTHSSMRTARKVASYIRNLRDIGHKRAFKN